MAVTGLVVRGMGTCRPVKGEAAVVDLAVFLIVAGLGITAGDLCKASTRPVLMPAIKITAAAATIILLRRLKLRHFDSSLPHHLLHQCFLQAWLILCRPRL